MGLRKKYNNSIFLKKLLTFDENWNRVTWLKTW